MRILNLLTLLFFASVAQANVWDGDIKLEQEYACLGIDGVPIGNSSPLAGQCCSDGQLIANAPKECRVGFNSISTDAGNGAAGGINIALQTLNVAENLDGNNMDPTSPQTNVGGSTSGYTPGEGVASVAGGTSAGGDGSGSAGPNAEGAAQSKGGSSGGSGAGGGSGFTVGSAGGTSGLKNSDGSSGDGKAGTGGYVKGGDGKGGAGGSGNPFGGFFGGGGNSAGGVGAGGANELAFGEGAGDVTGDGSGADGEDGDGRGTAEDPSDYFSRIDKSANIFKIVSARYMKKKSLWSIPQKLPEDLKQKKI